MNPVTSEHPYDILQEMDHLCIRMADTFPSEIQINEFWKGIGFILAGVNFITPWDGYTKQGNIFLSGGRGKGQLTNIKVLKNVSPTVFSSFE